MQLTIGFWILVCSKVWTYKRIKSLHYRIKSLYMTLSNKNLFPSFVQMAPFFQLIGYSKVIFYQLYNSSLQFLQFLLIKDLIQIPDFYLINSSSSLSTIWPFTYKLLDHVSNLPQTTFRTPSPLQTLSTLNSTCAIWLNYNNWFHRFLLTTWKVFTIVLKKKSTGLWSV